MQGRDEFTVGGRIADVATSGVDIRPVLAKGVVRTGRVEGAMAREWIGRRCLNGRRVWNKLDAKRTCGDRTRKRRDGVTSREDSTSEGWCRPVSAWLGGC